MESEMPWSISPLFNFLLRLGSSAMGKRHIQGLDSLRAVAIIGVILFHMFPAVVQGGYLGVVVFFVLSGYLISVSVLSDVDNDKFNVFKLFLRF